MTTTPSGRRWRRTHSFTDLTRKVRALLKGTSAAAPISSHSATWVSDLGVWDITAAKYLTRVASAPATGQYSVAAGVYTFAAADTTHQVQLFYDYTSAAVGTTIKTVNTQMGAINYFQLKLYNNFTDSSGVANSGLYFPNVYFSDQSLAFKNTDFVAHDVTWEAIQDASGNVRSVWTGN